MTPPGGASLGTKSTDQVEYNSMVAFYHFVIDQRRSKCKCKFTYVCEGKYSFP